MLKAYGRVPFQVIGPDCVCIDQAPRVDLAEAILKSVDSYLDFLRA